jgi:sugar phosphate isomerase/epimerase
MKLSLLTYNIARDWDLGKLIEVCKNLGFAGIEFRVEREHKHGIELDMDKKARKEAKERIQEAYLEVVGIGTSSKFEYSDPAKRREDIEKTKKYIELASDLEAKLVRVFGNDFEPGADRTETMKWVGESLAELYEFSKPYNVDVLLEMHGTFNNWNYALRAIEYSGSKDAGLVYNCDPRDVVGKSVRNTYSRVRHLIKHVHMHSLWKNYPYKEFLQLLKDDGYEGYLSAEIDEYSTDAETVLKYYSMLYYEMLSNLK